MNGDIRVSFYFMMERVCKCELVFRKVGNVRIFRKEFRKCAVLILIQVGSSKQSNDIVSTSGNIFWVIYLGLKSTSVYLFEVKL